MQGEASGRCLALLLLALLPLAAVEIDHAAAQVRQQAEAALEDSRRSRGAERTELTAALQRALAAAGAARDEQQEARREADQARDEASRRARERERALAGVRQAAERALGAARLDAAALRTLAGRPPGERVDAALAALEARVEALPARLAVRRADEAVAGRDGRVATAPVLRLGEARALALGATPALRGALERPAGGGVPVVAGPLPPADLAGAIPLDASGRAARAAAPAARGLGAWLAAGRLFIWPILLAGALGAALAAWRAWVLWRRRSDPRRLVQLARWLGAGDRLSAQAAVAPGATPLDRVLRAGLQPRPAAAREAAVEQALVAEGAALGGGLAAVAVLAGVAPLLGLLGTVTGMIDLFAVIAAEGSGSARSLSGGISEALVCTQAGMLVAVPLLLAHAGLARWAERGNALLEEAACAVLGVPADDAGPEEA